MRSECICIVSPFVDIMVKLACAKEDKGALGNYGMGLDWFSCLSVGLLQSDLRIGEGEPRWTS